MKRNLASVVAVLALSAAIACTPAVQDTQYSPTPAAKEQSASPLYCYLQGLINDEGTLTTAVGVINEPNPPQKWEELLCKDNQKIPYFVGIMLPSTWDGMNLSMDNIVKDVAQYQSQNSDKWKRLEVWMGRKGDTFAGFLVVTYEMPPQPGHTVNDVSAYKKLLQDLFGTIEKHAAPKGNIVLSFKYY